MTLDEKKMRQREATKRWRERNPERVKELSAKYLQKYKESRYQASRRWYQKLKSEVIAGYGGVCVCCGESNPKFLTIDHVNNDGFKERKINKSGNATALYSKLRRDGFPKDRFQLLCWNCNCGRATNGGVCPHVE